MLRHEFQPGRLVAGLVFAAAGTVYAGDAAGLWDTPWFVIVPLVVGGLCLAGATATVTRGIRRRSGKKRLGRSTLDG
ncbi:hypothetical protein AQI88_11180 [Streptomyces cellostaticus]|uniref:Uncharacterized protein n=1 Tax=Streptomyces cellostaticus TaxID=67285 RepID=A0A101NPG3_9ACTN|nr:hypothetical protein [Streptomyces cellostaticus]KUM96691.1 hypothetical protein AQI88_11180 [Streptomyces cellostaticus]GHI05525.1 hypothetical protein Scel_38460 [Streptomyces cellostaticus]